jgi:diguanylate cyclase (GGDEF)-like protein
MTIPFGLAGRLALAFIVLAALAQWLNYRASSDLRRAAVQQREVDKIKTVARVIEPQLKHEGERLHLITQLMLVQDGLSNGMQRKGADRVAAIAKILDFAYLQSRVDVLEVTDEQGIVLYRAQDPGRSGDLATAWGVAEALEGTGSLVSAKGTRGALVMSVEPIQAGGKVIGTVSAGTLIGESFIHALSDEVGADLALLTRSGDLVASNAPGVMTPDVSALTAAFQQKIPIYRSNEATRTTLVYLPVLIVDEAWVIMAEIDSTPAFDLLKKGDEKSALVTLLVVTGSILTTFLVLWYALKPLRELRLRAEKIFAELTGKTIAKSGDDGIVSIARVLGTLTELLLNRNRELIEHQAILEVEISRSMAAAEEINQLTNYDSLTLLPNRRLLLDRLKQALASSNRSHKYGVLLLIDLDNFKTLNDTLGHDFGDMLLQQVARRLVTSLREGDTVARLGGDEFVVMLEDLSENVQEAATQAEALGEKILATLNQPYQLSSYEYHSTSSIGVTLFTNHHESVDELLKQADLALYQAKAAGRNTLSFFDPEMQAVVTTRAALEAGLREAILNDQLLLHYQAQVTGERHLTGVEALVRWKHPQRGLVSPAEFIPVAEETGLILPLGNWVLETACSQLAGWATRTDMAHLSIAVNVSASQFHQADFVDQVLEVLHRTGANPQRLKLELTESLLVSNVEDIIAKMTELKRKGVGFSLDDFGTGYSSLSFLKRLPLDQLKIDQGFVRDILIDPNDAAIAKMVIVLAESLGLAVIAEGVETAAQRDFLARQGCHAYQGYLFSRPLPLEEFEAFAKQIYARPNEDRFDASALTA